jgi:outer membrane protein TolC
MKATRLSLLLILFLSLYVSSSFAESPSEKPLELADVLLRAEQYSPNLKSAEQEEFSAQQSVRISMSLYYPTLDATALDSTGFPASARAPSTFNGLMSSPYRVGISAGAFSTYTFFDLTREYGVKAAKYGVQASGEDIKVQRLDVDMQAMNLYMDAVLNLAQRESWKGIQDEVDRLYAVVKKFVRNGQYSEVTSWLLKNQTERALRQQEDFDLSYQAALRRIEIAIGAPEGTVTVAGLSQLPATLQELESHRLPESPLISLPKVQTEVSQAVTQQQSAQNYPRLYGLASVGGMDDSRLEPKQDYSAWIGVTVPIFEGFRITAEEQRARAEAESTSDRAKQAELDVADSDTRFDQQTKIHKSDIEHLQIERDDALKALKLAEHRYVTFVGDLADVRDSLYSYESSESDLNAAQVELYRSKLARAIIDGGYLVQTMGQDLK